MLIVYFHNLGLKITQCHIIFVSCFCIYFRRPSPMQSVNCVQSINCAQFNLLWHIRWEKKGGKRKVNDKAKLKLVTGNIYIMYYLSLTHFGRVGRHMMYYEKKKWDRMMHDISSQGIRLGNISYILLGRIYLNYDRWF